MNNLRLAREIAHLHARFLRPETSYQDNWRFDWREPQIDIARIRRVRQRIWREIMREHSKGAEVTRDAGISRRRELDRVERYERACPRAGKAAMRKFQEAWLPAPKYRIATEQHASGQNDPPTVQAPDRSRYGKLGPV